MIKYLKNHQIDRQKWDRCIKNAPNGVIYGYSWYLDHVADNWDGIIEDDYVSVFPLPWKKKIFIKYVYQPFFCQQLGLFSINGISESIINAFLRKIPIHFILVDINVNAAFCAKQDQAMLRPMKNYLLPLKDAYDLLFKNYDSNHQKNIKKTYKEHLEVKTTAPSETISLFRETYGKLYPGIAARHYDQFEKLIMLCIEKEMGECLGVYTADGVLCAAGCFLYDGNRYYYVMGAPTALGRSKKAIYYLIDTVIRKNSGKNLILDFEGSEIPNVEYFYKNFGAKPEYYFNLKISRYGSGLFL